MITAVSSTTETERAVSNTPLIRLEFKSERIALFAKCEYQGPSGSIKDRFAYAVIGDAERRGLLNRSSIILEYSCGGAGVAFAMAGAARGYKVKIVVPETYGDERRLLLKEIGAEVLTFNGSTNWRGIKLTRDLARGDARYFLPRQFENQLNVVTHEIGTGREILGQIDGPIDALVAGYGTGGTVAGVSRALRSRHPGMQVYLREFSEDATSLHGFLGARQDWIGEGSFVPPLLVGVRHGGAIRVPYVEARDMAQRLFWDFGLAVGEFSGANIVSSLRVAKYLGPKAQIVTILCDKAEKHCGPAPANQRDMLPSARLEVQR